MEEVLLTTAGLRSVIAVVSVQHAGRGTGYHTGFSPSNGRRTGAETAPRATIWITSAGRALVLSASITVIGQGVGTRRRPEMQPKCTGRAGSKVLIWQAHHRRKQNAKHRPGNRVRGADTSGVRADQPQRRQHGRRDVPSRN